MPIDRLLNALEARGCRPRKTGEGWKARCPSHEDKNPSLSIADDPVRVHCFSGCDSEEIIRALGFDGWADLLKEGNDPPPMTARTQKRSQDRGGTSPGALPSEDDLTRWCERLFATPQALEQLETVRAWSPEILAYLGVGLAFPEEVRAFRPNYQGRPRVTIPVRDAQGELVNVVFYAPDPATRQEREPKSLAISGRPRDLVPTPERLRVMLNGKAGRSLFLVEGEPDGIAGLSAHLPCCGIPGASTWKNGWAERFEGFDVMLLLDDDPAGNKAAQRILKTFADAKVYARALNVSSFFTDA